MKQRQPIKIKTTHNCEYSQCGILFNKQNAFQKHCRPAHYFADMDEKEKADEEKVIRKIKPIPKMSEKRKKELVTYLKRRIEFLNNNPICAVTGNSATEVHHTFSGKDRNKYYLDKSTWLPVSREGHNWIHSNPKESRELGYLK